MQTDHKHSGSEVYLTTFGSLLFAVKTLQANAYAAKITQPKMMSPETVYLKNGSASA